MEVENQTIDQLLGYLQTRPWGEVNQLIVQLLRIVQTAEAMKSEKKSNELPAK